MLNVENKSKVLSVLVRRAKDGERVWDVFDLMYKSSLPYDELKDMLDVLAESGDVICRDVKTYEYAGAAERNDVAEPPEEKAIEDKFEEYRRYFEEYEARRNTNSDDDDDLDIDDIVDQLDDDESSDIPTSEACAAAGREFLEKHEIEFTENMRKVLSIAVSAAEKFGSTYIGSEHVVYAMIITESAAKTSLGFTAENVIEYTAAFLGALCDGKNADGFTEDVKNVISEAVQYAKELDDENACAGTEHLLFKILTHHDCAAVKIINGMHVRLVDIYKRLAKALNT